MTQSAAAAKPKLSAQERKVIAVRALASAEPISALAVWHGVSRPLVYRQMHHASAALDDLFSPAPTDNEEAVIFTLPVTHVLHEGFVPQDGWQEARVRLVPPCTGNKMVMIGSVENYRGRQPGGTWSGSRKHRTAKGVHPITRKTQIGIVNLKNYDGNI